MLVGASVGVCIPEDVGDDCCSFDCVNESDISNVIDILETLFISHYLISFLNRISIQPILHCVVCLSFGRTKQSNQGQLADAGVRF